MMKIQNVAELEERLSRPGDADASAMAALNGDVLMLGLGGEMGPGLSPMARSAAGMAALNGNFLTVGVGGKIEPSLAGWAGGAADLAGTRRRILELNRSSAAS